jgi:hypothetical protein
VYGKLNTFFLRKKNLWSAADRRDADVMNLRVVAGFLPAIGMSTGCRKHQSAAGKDNVTGLPGGLQPPQPHGIVPSRGRFHQQRAARFPIALRRQPRRNQMAALIEQKEPLAVADHMGVAQRSASRHVVRSPTSLPDAASRQHRPPTLSIEQKWLPPMNAGVDMVVVGRDRVFHTTDADGFFASSLSIIEPRFQAITNSRRSLNSTGVATIWAASKVVVQRCCQSTWPAAGFSDEMSSAVPTIRCRHPPPVDHDRRAAGGPVVERLPALLAGLAVKCDHARLGPAADARDQQVPFDERRDAGPVCGQPRVVLPGRVLLPEQLSADRVQTAEITLRAQRIDSSPVNRR